MTLFLNNDDVKAVLTMKTTIALLEDAYKLSDTSDFSLTRQMAKQ